MGKHGTEYARIERDLYPTTPPWPVAALAEHVTLRGKTVWEFACGTDDMAASFRAEGATVFTSDVHDYGLGQDAVFDFLSPGTPVGLPRCDLSATNPPFGLQGRTAVAFIERGLQRLPMFETLALLLPCDFDSGKTRTHLFRDCPHFVGKIVLTRRIKWFVHAGKEKVTPRENSAWFIWSRTPRQSPSPALLYAPSLIVPSVSSMFRYGRVAGSIEECRSPSSTLRPGRSFSTSTPPKRIAVQGPSSSSPAPLGSFGPSKITTGRRRS
jgi:hypothetical protein